MQASLKAICLTAQTCQIQTSVLTWHSDPSLFSVDATKGTDVGYIGQLPVHDPPYAVLRFGVPI
jgi:hypothetical protein